MDEKKTARERIMEVFVNELQDSPVTEEETAMMVRIAGVLDSHFERHCSFYDRPKLISMLPDIPDYYKSFLSRLTDYERLSVSALAKKAGVNRTTFYKIFPNVNALYDACCEELTSRFLAVPLPKEKTQETMTGYGSALWNVMAENNALLFTLSHRVQKRQLPYIIGYRLKNRMETSLTQKERSSFSVKENLELFPELFSVWFSLIQIELLAPGLYPDRDLPVYRPERSLIENIADRFVELYGGSFDFFYSLGGAALKLLAKKRFNEISVSELCGTAGYPRSTFYTYFTDRADYVMKVCENAVMVCLSAFLYFLEHQEALTPGALAVFRGELVDYKLEGIRAIFRNGSITYIFPVLFAYLMRIFIAAETKRRGCPPDDKMHSLISFYIGYAIRIFSMNYLGDMTDTELFLKTGELARIKKRILED